MAAAERDVRARTAHTEELVWAETEDGVRHGGVLILPTGRAPSPVAVVWIHGGATNFYAPEYVGIGRAAAAAGRAFLAGNTRARDAGFILGRKDGRPVMGGSWWLSGEGATHPDVAAWISFAQGRGFSGVILAGHSAGARFVAQYQAERKDTRVAALVLASAPRRATAEPVTAYRDPALLERARRMLAEGRGDEWIAPGRVGRITPECFLSLAAIDWERDDPTDLYGIDGPGAAPLVARIDRPVLAVYASQDHGGTGAEVLDRIRRRWAAGAEGAEGARVDTALIEGAPHMYTGSEDAVAAAIARWLEAATAPTSTPLPPPTMSSR